MQLTQLVARAQRVNARRIAREKQCKYKKSAHRLNIPDGRAHRRVRKTLDQSKSGRCSSNGFDHYSRQRLRIRLRDLLKREFHNNIPRGGIGTDTAVAISLAHQRALTRPLRTGAEAPIETCAAFGSSALDFGPCLRECAPDNPDKFNERS